MAIPKFIPLAFAVAAVAWWFFCEWLRHRAYRKHIHTRIAPSTQHFVWMRSIGVLVLAAAGFVLAMIGRSR